MDVILGLGCDRGVSLLTLETAIEQALEKANLALMKVQVQVKGIASIDKKNDEVAILQLANKNQWPMFFFPAEELANVNVPNPSKIVEKYMGTPSVSEAAAILAAKTDMNNLVLEKYKYLGQDKKNATVTIVSISDAQ